MNKCIYILLLFCYTYSHSQNNPDEFSGPYKSWANVKLRFGAKGDGKTDDTKALQKALDSLTVNLKSFNTGNKAYVVVYLPAGKYIISNTLVLKGKIGISIIGEDPATTTIVWKGNASDTMLWTNGSAYFKIARLSWDTKGIAGMEAIGLHWKERWNTKESQSFAALNIEISDCIFKGGFLKGISGGTSEEGTNHNDSEIAIKRCSFYSCTEAGIKIRGYNALDYWIWDCKFYNCKMAVYNDSGNYHLYRCFFYRSTFFDVANKNGYYTSVRDSYSYNSFALSGDEGVSCNPFKRVFQGNTIVSTKKVSVQFYHVGKITLLDNNFTKNIDTASRANVDYGSWCPGNYEVLSVNNKFEYSKPVRMEVPKKKMRSYRDNMGKAALKADTAAFLNTLQKTTTKITRTVFEVPLKASRKDIQLIINKASKLTGKRAVVHFPLGQYMLDSPLVVPAGSDIQIIGDGLIYSSTILAMGTFPKNKSMLAIKGPSKVTIRDIQFGQNSSNKDSLYMVSFSNVDQAGSMALTDQVYSSATHSINMEGLCNLYVQNENSFFCMGNRVIGCGNCTNKCSSRFATFGGQFAGIKVENDGRFTAKDCWWEGDKKTFQNISGKGSITIDGAMIAPVGADSTPTMRINDFEGKISLLNMYIQGALDIKNENKKLSFFAWNIHFYHKMLPLAFLRSPNYKGVFNGITTQCFNASNPACGKIVSVPDEEFNINNEEEFMLDMINEDRTSKAVFFRTIKKESSAIFISRVSFGNCIKGLVFSK